MPNIEQIICLINENFKQVFTDKNFIQNKIYGLTQPLQRKTEVMPAYLDGKEWRYVGPDDTQNLIIYHKLYTNNYDTIQGLSYGRKGGLDKCTSECSVVVFGQRNKLNVSQYDLELLVNQHLITRISKAKLAEFKLQSVNIAPVSSTMDMATVFGQEFKNVPYTLNEKHILFEFKYSIEAIYDASCLPQCSTN